MKILVTGGAGFIGSHLVDQLIKEDHKVVVIDNLSTGKKENLNPKAKFYKIDICDEKISQIFKKEKPEAVFHYAAQINVRKSVENPIEDAKVNILGTLNILESCKKYGIKKFTFASTVGVYGNTEDLPVSENHPLNPISPYTVSKLAIENYLNYYKREFGFVLLRFANVYGPRQITTGEGGVVAIFIDNLLNQKIPTIYGDGNQTRDFVYIEDVVEANILTLNNSKRECFYNIGTGIETTINNLFRLISQKTKTDIAPVYESPREEDIYKSCVDYSKIKKELGWQPKYNLERGLQKTINQFRMNNY